MSDKAVGRLILAVVWGVVGVLLFWIVVLTAASTSLAPAEDGVWWAWGERLEVQDSQVFGFVPELATALVIVVGGYVAWRRVKASDRQADIARATLVTEQFAKAIEQISSLKLMERVGGIHTLERLAHDDQPGNHKDDWLDEGSLAVTVTQVLFGHLRELVGPMEEDDERQMSEVERSTVVRALARLPEGCTGHIDAPGINLAGANLSNIRLAGANLSSAKFASANLTGADLFGADLNRADLRGAKLARANLTRAGLFGADLTRTDLFEANLFEANLTHVCLDGANLFGADLTGARAPDAKFVRADLTGADLTGADLSS